MEGHTAGPGWQALLPPWAFGILLATLVGCSSGYRPTPSEGGPFQANVITAEDIAAFPSTISVEEVIQQLAPGIWISRRNEPGGAMSMNVRGMGAPLFVIDGIPREFQGANLELNPRDVERIEILKEGGSVAMYGMRGANGVILIQTKGSVRSGLR